jgi:dipeptidase E
VIYVGGGNVVSMLGAWRAHGLDEVLREAWRQGIVLCGPSAGSLCWFEQALSAFHGAPRSVRGLGLLPYSNCVHYDAEPARRAEYHRFVSEGMQTGFAVEDGVALHFCGTRLEQVVSSRPDGHAYLVEPAGEGVMEAQLQAVYLGERGHGGCQTAAAQTNAAAPGAPPLGATPSSLASQPADEHRLPTAPATPPSPAAPQAAAPQPVAA